MEILTLIFAGILSIFTPIGIISDHIAANQIRSQTESIDKLAVRIDNIPSYQITQGKIDRLRIASRGVQLTPEVRLDVLEIETDPLEVNLQRLRNSEQDCLRACLRQPLQAGVRLVVTEEDLNQAFQAPEIKIKLQQIFNSFVAKIPFTPPQGYEIIDIKLDLLGENRLASQIQLQPIRTNSATDLDIPTPVLLEMEVGLEVVEGKKLSFTEPKVTYDNSIIPSSFSSGILNNVSRRLDLENLQEEGILLRILQLGLEEDYVEIATFIRAEPLANN